MAQPFRARQRLLAELASLIRIAQEPQHKTEIRQGDDAWIGSVSLDQRAVQPHIVDAEPALQMIPRVEEAAGIKHGHAERPVRLDEMAGSQASVVWRLLLKRRLRQAQQLGAEIMGFRQIRPDEMADPKPSRRGKYLFVVVELLAELERAQIILLDLLHRVTLGGDQRVPELDAQGQLHLVATRISALPWTTSRPRRRWSIASRLAPVFAACLPAFNQKLTAASL